jgi:hypothetical protein
MMKIITNPNIVYIFAYAVPFAVYALGWSDLYPPLSLSLLCFYFFTFFCCAAAGYFYGKLNKVQYRPITVSNLNVFFLTVIYFLYFIEFLYSGFIPLFAFIRGAEYGEVIYGVPTLHTILVTFNCFYAVYLFHQYVSTKRKRLLFYYLLTVFPFILLVQRSSIMHILAASFYIFLLSLPRIRASFIGGAVVFILVIFYLFGYLGNVRSGRGDPTFIPRASGATERFLESPVPKEFYWSYLYISSPVASFQYNIDHSRYIKKDLTSLMLYEGMPDFFAKRIAVAVGKEKRSFVQMNDFLNVGTIYADPYSYLQWEGPVLIFLWLLLIINLYMFVIVRSSRYCIVGLSIVINVIVFGNYHNTIAYSALSFQLVYPVLFSMFRIR